MQGHPVPLAEYRVPCGRRGCSSSARERNGDECVSIGADLIDRLRVAGSRVVEHTRACTCCSCEVDRVTRIRRIHHTFRGSLAVLTKSQDVPWKIRANFTTVLVYNGLSWPRQMWTIDPGGICFAGSSRWLFHNFSHTGSRRDWWIRAAIVHFSRCGRHLK